MQSSEFHLGTPDAFVVYCGDDMMVLQVLAQGGVGVVSGGSHVVGDKVKQMIDLFMKGESLKATDLSLDLFRFYQSLNQNGRINPIPILRAAISMSWKEVGSPRLPLLPATDEERAVVHSILADLGVAVSA